MFEEIFSIVSLVVVLGLLLFYFFVKKKDGKDGIYLICFLVLFSIGIALHIIAHDYKGYDSLPFMLIESITSALKVFGANFSSSTYSALAQESMFFNVTVIVHFIVCTFLTSIVIIRMFFQNIINHIKTLIASQFSKKIVVGYNGKTQTFLNSLKERNNRIIIILENKNKIHSYDLVRAGYNVVTMQDGNITENTKRALAKAGVFNARKDTHVISMSESEEQNIVVAKIIADYIKNKILPITNSKGRIEKLTAMQETLLEQTRLWAYVLCNDKIQSFDFNGMSLGRVRNFDTYDMNARRFVMDYPLTKMIPAEWVDTSKARLNRQYKISNIFVGFGEMNRQILRKNICNNQFLGSDFKALIIGSEVRKQEKAFMIEATGLFRPELKSTLDEKKKARYFVDAKEQTKFAFYEQDVMSFDFYDRVIEEVRVNDFSIITIALGDDKLGLDTAIKTRQKLYEADLLAKDNNPRVRIFVRIKQHTVFSDEELLGGFPECKIETFGTDKEIINEEYIIGEKLDIIAKRIANNYAENSSACVASVTQWDVLPELERDSNRYAAMSIGTKLNLLGFDFIKSDKPQDQAIIEEFSNAYNIKLANKQQETVNKQWSTGDFKDGYVDFLERVGGKIADTARNNLARLEHQRWNSFYFSNGWTKFEKSKVTGKERKNVKAKQHACLTTFEELEALQKMQTEILVNEGMTEVRAKSETDVIRYDFFLMDKLISNVRDSGYVIIKK
ncbi:MAG: NAD-binding protein [Firmicutes bacterium]|nr:NAD-binding protein [Bacillota bacterium]